MCGLCFIIYLSHWLMRSTPLAKQSRLWWCSIPLFDHWYFTVIILRVYLTCIEAFLLILMHATFLRKSNKPEAALTKAALDYQEANIELKIQEYLKSLSPEDSVETFSGFIMATELGLFIFPVVTTISHWFFSAVSVLSQSQCVKKTIVDTVVGANLCKSLFFLLKVEEHRKEGDPKLNGCSRSWAMYFVCVPPNWTKSWRESIPGRFPLSDISVLVNCCHVVIRSVSIWFRALTSLNETSPGTSNRCMAVRKTHVKHQGASHKGSSR